MTDLQPKPQLEDPLHEKEIFSNDVVGVGMMHGNLVITLANIRFDESSGTESPKMRRVVSAKTRAERQRWRSAPEKPAKFFHTNAGDGSQGREQTT